MLRFFINLRAMILVDRIFEPVWKRVALIGKIILPTLDVWKFIVRVQTIGLLKYGKCHIDELFNLSHIKLFSLVRIMKVIVPVFKRYNWQKTIVMNYKFRNVFGYQLACDEVESTLLHVGEEVNYIAH